MRDAWVPLSLSRLSTSGVGGRREHVSDLGGLGASEVGNGDTAYGELCRPALLRLASRVPVLLRRSSPGASSTTWATLTRHRTNAELGEPLLMALEIAISRRPELGEPLLMALEISRAHGRVDALECLLEVSL